MLKWEAESELPGDESRQKNKLQNFQEEYYTEQFLCVVRSTQSAKHVKCSACFFSSWDFSVTHGGMYDIEQLKASHQQKKSDKKYAEDFPLIFMGCETPSSQHLDVIRAETLFTKFFVVHNIALCSRSWHLFWRTFPQKRIAEEDHVIMYATLKI